MSLLCLVPESHPILLRMEGANDVSPLELKILEPYDVLEIDLSDSRQMQNRFD